jgi:hypothetical protein
MAKELYAHTIISHLADVSAFGAGIAVDQQRFLFKGRQLQESYTLADYNIRRGSTIHFLLKLRGD